MNDLDKEFEILVKPIIKWLNENYSPNAQISIGRDGAEISVGIKSIVCEEYIKD